MRLYSIYDTYHMYHTLYNISHRYSDFLKEAITYKIPSIVDFGTARINKRKRKRNRRK